MTKFAAVETGGTSVSVAIAEGHPSNIVEDANFPTTTPEETLTLVKNWLSSRKFDSLAVASFGPVELKQGHEHWGFITTTPKPGWGYANVMSYFKDFGVPTAFETDVNAPAYSEAQARGVSSCCYITVGTGVGVGVVADGQPIHGLMHPEGGHIPMMRREGDLFEGSCPFHGPCLEGMVATGALARRAGLPAADLPSLPDTHPLWDTVAYYLAQLCVNLIYIVSPQHIVLGGGVMQRKCLLDKVHQHVGTLLAGYVAAPEVRPENLSKYITEPIHARAGLVGALTLAQKALTEK